MFGNLVISVGEELNFSTVESQLLSGSKFFGFGTAQKRPYTEAEWTSCNSCGRSRSSTLTGSFSDEKTGPKNRKNLGPVESGNATHCENGLQKSVAPTAVPQFPLASENSPANHMSGQEARVLSGAVASKSPHRPPR